MYLLPTPLDDEAVPLTAAAADETAVLFMLELEFVWLNHYLIYLTQWAKKILIFFLWDSFTLY